MKKINVLFFIICLQGCSNISNIYDKTFTDEVINCPDFMAPKGTAELIINSEKNVQSYIGFRGISKKCYAKKSGTSMYLSANVRSIRKNYKNDDYIPIKIFLISLDEKGNEYDRDEFEFKMFVKSGSKIVERETNMKVFVPKNGKSYIGLLKD